MANTHEPYEYPVGDRLRFFREQKQISRNPCHILPINLNAASIDHAIPEYIPYRHIADQNSCRNSDQQINSDLYPGNRINLSF